MSDTPPKCEKCKKPLTKCPHCNGVGYFLSGGGRYRDKKKTTCHTCWGEKYECKPCMAAAAKAAKAADAAKREKTLGKKISTRIRRRKQFTYNSYAKDNTDLILDSLAEIAGMIEAGKKGGGT